MTGRERILTFAVGGLLAMLALFWIVNQVDRAFSRRAGIRRQLEGQLRQKQQILTRARQDSRRLAAYEKMSLPSDAELARSQYQAWLSQLLEQTKVRNPQVKVVAQSKRAGGATQLTCSVSGKGDIQQVAQLLYDFYSVQTIHRIRRLPLKPIADSRLLDMNLLVEALILPTAPPDQNFDGAASSPIASASSESFVRPVLERNMFSRENNAPQIANLGTRQVRLGESLSYSVRARDPDLLDQLQFAIVEGPEGVRIDQQSGRLTWTPRATGEFSVLVQVTDDGIPPLDARQPMAIRVTDPPASTAEKRESTTRQFDEARFAYAIATLEVAGQRQLWLHLRTQGKILKLYEGDSLDIGSVSAVVSKISDRGAELQSDGQRSLVFIGDPLVATNIVPTSH